MEALFLKILNMSITASYVILAILLLRLLLSKAPKKYSYILWSAAAFRLCCPISFQSIFSLFNLKIFHMPALSGSPVSELKYIPENIGSMAQPTITTGISPANTLINKLLPEATPMYSVNPMQLLILEGMALWFIGMTVLLLYSIVSFIRLRLRMDHAVLLAGNVYQSDRVRSPFILGLVRPKIYIPFGLDAQTQDSVLTHERYHIRRGDPFVKMFAFILLVIHWFNPLCWIAFRLMSRDMEMSCDEKVLSLNAGIRTSYSTSLLSFAANRRFPTPSPLAFGESGVKQRIKNVLNWKKPKVRFSVLAGGLCIAALIFCASNPSVGSQGGSSAYWFSRLQSFFSFSAESDHSDSAFGEALPGVPAGSYRSSSCVYMNPLSSYSPINGDSGYQYTISDDHFILQDRSSDAEYILAPDTWAWSEFPYSSEEWEALFFLSIGAVSLDQPEDILWLKLSSRYELLLTDGGLWLVQLNENPQMGKYIWSIYVLEPEDSAP